MTKIAIISCTKMKQEFPCDVKTMYQKSELFSKIVKYVECQEYTEWFVISAKYGLLSSKQIIEPYDITLNNMKASERKKWAEITANQIIELGVSEIDFYAGKKYREYLIPILEDKSIICNVPMKGLGIGQQLKFLKDRMLER